MLACCDCVVVLCCIFSMTCSPYFILQAVVGLLLSLSLELVY
jgi:hypothetical protein